MMWYTLIILTFNEHSMNKESGGFPSAEQSQEQSYTSDMLFPAKQEMIKKFEEKGLGEYAVMYQAVLKIAEKVREQGGRALLVGGCVRDYVLGALPKDFDVEVYHLTPALLRGVLEQCGAISEVGSAFGILKVRIEGSILDIDVSMPRIDSKKQDGHKGFEVNIDPNMSIIDAARRRDFTMNSLAADPLTGELFDPYGGIQNLADRVLKITDPERFKDDPLRVLRAMQFAGRFGLEIDQSSVCVLQEMAQRFEAISPERFFEEWKKLLLKSPKPSVGLSAAMGMGVFHYIHPEFDQMPATEQDGGWHPEGDVWIHTLMVVDEAAKIIRQEQLDEDTALVLMLSAFVHDLGKPVTTQFEEGRWRARGHEPAGKDPAKRFLEKIGVDAQMQAKVLQLVVDHLKPAQLFQQHEEYVRHKHQIAGYGPDARDQVAKLARVSDVSDGAIRKLAQRIAPATIQELVLLEQADHLGRGPFMDEMSSDQFLLPDPSRSGDWLLRRAREIGVENSKPVSAISGKELVALGMKQGEDIGTVIRAANVLRDDLGWTVDDIKQFLNEFGSDHSFLVAEIMRVSGTEQPSQTKRKQKS